MSTDVSAAGTTYAYGDALYWDSRYVQEGEASPFDWYQNYSALRPFIRKYISPNSSVLMAGCGNAVISEEMVRDGYEDIMNIDISSVLVEVMRKKNEDIPQLKYMQMDVRDMSLFSDESFDSVIDKGTLDALLCGIDADISASQMLGGVTRLLKPGGVYMLITYGDPTTRMPHINQPVYNWKIELYLIPKSGSTSKMEPVPITENGLIPEDYVYEDPESHFVYVCKKIEETTNNRDESKYGACEERD